MYLLGYLRDFSLVTHMCTKIYTAPAISIRSSDETKTLYLLGHLRDSSPAAHMCITFIPRP